MMNGSETEQSCPVPFLFNHCVLFDEVNSMSVEAWNKDFSDEGSQGCTCASLRSKNGGEVCGEEVVSGSMEYSKQDKSINGTTQRIM